MAVYRTHPKGPAMIMKELQKHWEVFGGDDRLSRTVSRINRARRGWAQDHQLFGAVDGLLIRALQSNIGAALAMGGYSGPKEYHEELATRLPASTAWRLGVCLDPEDLPPGSYSMSDFYELPDQWR